MRLKRFSKEVLRKLVHLIGLPIIVAYSAFRFYWSERAGLIFLAALLLFLLKVEYVRLEYKIKLPPPLNLFRKREQHNVAGWIFFVSGMIIVFAAFDFFIASAALLMTVFGDMVSALAGMRFGKKKLVGKKTYVGFISGLVANLIVGFLVLGNQPAIVGVMALIASLIELFTNKLDDNLTVPLSSAFAGHTMVLMMGMEILQIDSPVSWLLNWLLLNYS